MEKDPDEKALYSVAEKTVGVRLQKAVDPDVAALLDSDDFSTSDLEEDFVLQANIHEEGEDDVIDKKLTKDVDENNAQESQEDLVEFLDGAEDDNIIKENTRVRGLLDEQFDEVIFLFLCVCVLCNLVHPFSGTFDMYTSRSQ